MHPVPGGDLAPGEPLLLTEAPEFSGRRCGFAHPARAAGTEPATTGSDRNGVLQQPRPHQMRRRVQPLRDRGESTNPRPRTAAATGPWVGRCTGVNAPLGRFFNDPDGGVRLGLGEPTPHSASTDPQPVRDRGGRQITAEFGKFLPGWRSQLTPESAGTSRADLNSRLQQPPSHRPRPHPVLSLEISGRPLLVHIQPAQHRRCRVIPGGQRHGVSGGHRATLNTGAAHCATSGTAAGPTTCE